MKNHVSKKSGYRTPRMARGFTLVEVLIAMGLGVGILLALTMLFSSNSGNQAELERTIRQLENARFSLDTLAEDVMHAGYYSEFNPDPLAPAYQTPDPCSTASSAPGWNTAVNPIQMPVPIQGITRAGVAGCLQNRRAGTEAIVIRRAETSGVVGICNRVARNEYLYIQVSRCGNDAARLRTAAGSAADATFDLRLPTCTPLPTAAPDCSNPATLASYNNRVHRLTQRTYYVADCNNCAPSDGIPTLKRAELLLDPVTNTVDIRRTSIAEGVEDFQVEYGLDNNNDGQPDIFFTLGPNAAPAVITGVAPNVWENVVTVRLHVLTRSTQTTPGFTDPRTYQVGPDVSLTTPADGFKRTLMTTTVRLMNVGMRRE